MFEETTSACPGATAGNTSTVLLEISLLLPADSPRISGEDPAHIRILSETDSALPPILVHRPSLRVIDGMHRLRAASLRGAKKIEAMLFDGDENEAFIKAVEANIAHGLPLSLADREAAAERILAARSELSDRAVAASTGLATGTVRAIRKRSGIAHPDVRVGLDGRFRPLSTCEGRRLAGELMKASPDSTLRQIAKASGISLGTASDVRDRLKRGEDPVPSRQHEVERRRFSSEGPAGSPRAATAQSHDGRDRAAILRNLSRDPALRFSESGRHLIRWLDGHTADTADWPELIGAIPPHCGEVVVDLARRTAAAWQSFAEEIEHRLLQMPDHPRQDTEGPGSKHFRPIDAGHAHRRL